VGFQDMTRELVHPNRGGLQQAQSGRSHIITLYNLSHLDRRSQSRDPPMRQVIPMGR
jgi:hypothetical protein